MEESDPCSFKISSNWSKNMTILNLMKIWFILDFVKNLVLTLFDTCLIKGLELALSTFFIKFNLMSDLRCLNRGKIKEESWCLSYNWALYC